MQIHEELAGAFLSLLRLGYKVYSKLEAKELRSHATEA